MPTTYKVTTDGGTFNITTDEGGEEPNSFLTSPHGFIREGARTIGQGVKELFTPGSREAGATHVLKGAGSMLAPVGIGALIPAFAAAPAATVGGLASAGLGAAGGGVAGRKIASVAGGGPEAQELVGTVGETLGGAAGGLAGAGQGGQNVVRGAAKLPVRALAKVSPEIAKDIGRFGGYVAGHWFGGWPGGFIAGKLGGDLAARAQAAASKSVAGTATAEGGQDAAILEGLAKSLEGKSFDKLSDADKEIIRNMASKRAPQPEPPAPPEPPRPPQWWMTEEEKALANRRPSPSPAPQPIPEARQLNAPRRVFTSEPPPDTSRVIVTTGEPLSYGGPRQLTGGAPPVPRTIDQALSDARARLLAQGSLPEGYEPNPRFIDRFDVGSGAPTMRGPQTKTVQPSENLKAKPGAVEAAKKLAKAMKENN